MDDRDPALTEARAARALGCGRRRGVLVLATLLASACATVEAPVEVEVDDEPPYAVWPSGTLADELCVTCTRGHMWKVDTDTFTSAEGHAAHEAGGTAATIEDVPMPSWTLVVSEMPLPDPVKQSPWAASAMQLREAEVSIVRHIAAYHPVFVSVLDELTCRVLGTRTANREMLLFECFLMEEALREFKQSNELGGGPRTGSDPAFDPATSYIGDRYPPTSTQCFLPEGTPAPPVEERKYRFDIAYDVRRACVMYDNLSPSAGHRFLTASPYLLTTPVAPTVVAPSVRRVHGEGSEAPRATGKGSGGQAKTGQGSRDDNR